MAKYSPSLPNILGYICQIPASTEGITYTRIFASVTTSTNLKQNEAHSARAESTHPWIVVPASAEGITDTKIHVSVMTSTNPKHAAWFQNLWVKINIYLKNH